MARLPEETLARIKAEVPLETLCREHAIELSGSGKNLLGKCPFHEDGEPSFVVTPNKNLWNCLAGCGGGDTIQLLMRLENISFRRAADKLAARLGLAPEAATVETRQGTSHDILTDPGESMNDAALMAIVTDFYHQTFLNHPQAMQYLAKRKCFHPEAVKRFRIGYANRTLGYRVPTTTAAGNTLKSRLQKLGILRDSGHEHLNGSVIFPICDRHNAPVQMYGRKLNDNLRKGTPAHLYLEGPLRGAWNGDALTHQREIILCESILDALTFWCAGFRNVTASFGAGNIGEDVWKLLHDVRPARVILAQDNDPAGNDAVQKLAPRLGDLGISVLRVKLPPGCDINAFACQSGDASRALAALIEEAEILVAHAAPNNESTKEKAATISDETPPEQIARPAPDPVASTLAAQTQAASSSVFSVPSVVKNSSLQSSDLTPIIQGDDILFTLGDRAWRIRGLAKNLSYEALRVQIRVTRNEAFHLDTRDLLSAKQREAFLREAAAELHQPEDLLKRDLGRILLKLEELQEQNIRRALEPKAAAVPGMTAEESAAALELLRSPDLLGKILSDFDACGVVGEDTNKLVGYLAATSRKFERPLGVIIQSTSAAGKTTLMEAVLAFMPEEERVKYSALTGQALFYLGEQDIRHKILAIAEEEGAEKATYALKLLQSEGELTIASTGKDATTGRMETQEYHVQGPAMIFFTTTSIEVDEELANRCLVLTVDESREQTRRIHQLQREEETLEGHHHRERAAIIRHTHQNAQRLIANLPVHNPFARLLTFPDENTRLRRDQKKYLTLIRTIALLHQHQRPRRSVHGTEHVEVTLEDIATANRLAGVILGRSLDEMPPQTRRFLDLLWAMVKSACEQNQIDPKHHRFTQREARAATGWSPPQVKRHMMRLHELEYILTHRGGRGQGYVYELIYQGEGGDGTKFLPGLITAEQLAAENARAARTYDGDRDGQNDNRHPHGIPPAPPQHAPGTPTQNPLQPSKINASSPSPDRNRENTQPDPEKTLIPS